ncbi:hypothetical protein [Hyalangium rubrum]|uniref:DUF4174 domain-containing protein n=1 Tax=Hyalangium rubrum TaxID=3103134 RepID=A0ABU5GX96_9BACT|nr:hypothetical protein [Hyalangium sp. s54d21]MDY7225813.1 hypothetical protein [Hyalangium sp. s54d21]
MPLIATMVLLTQAPAASDEPITVLIAPPDTAGVPSHVVEFAQEHVAEQARSKGLAVKRMKDIMRKMPAAKRRALLRCKRTDLKCLISLGEAAKTEVVLVAELLQRLDGYRVGTKVYRATDGALVAEHLIPGVREDGMLDALTQSLDVVVPRMRKELRPSAPPPPDEVQPPPNPQTDPQNPQDVKPPPSDVKPPPSDVKPTPPPDVTPVAPPEVARQGSSARRWAWAPAAGGAVFAGVGTYFYLQARDRHDKLTNADGPLDGAKLAKEGKQAQTLSRVGFGLGAAGLITGAVLFLLPGEEAPVRPTVSVGPGGGMVGVAGTLP